MAALSENMIMEIVARLPLKYAIQCLVLNKTLFRLISVRKNALALSSYPDTKSSIFYHFSNIFIRFGSNCEKSIILRPVILDSCNGILLLKDADKGLCVFNPLTRGILFVGSPFSFDGDIKLAVDLQDSTTFHFKLVKVELNRRGDSRLWKISILSPLPWRPGCPSWLVKSLKFEGCCSSDRCSSKSVYAHGCMYWPLCKNPNEIMVLDLAKEEIRTISFPFSAAPLLFGLSDGSLQSVCELQHQIVIRGYDEVNNEWVLKHQVSNIVPCSRVRFFDGQRLLVTHEVHGYTTNTRGTVHDVLSGKWDKIGGGNDFHKIEGQKTILSFVPSLAKVSDEYLDKVMAKSELYFASLAGLQHLITQEFKVTQN